MEPDHERTTLLAALRPARWWHWPAVFAHGDVTPQAVDTSRTCPSWATDWRAENPFRGHDRRRSRSAPRPTTRTARAATAWRRSPVASRPTCASSTTSASLKDDKKKDSLRRRRSTSTTRQRAPRQGAQRRGLHAALRRHPEPGGDVVDQGLPGNAAREAAVNREMSDRRICLAPPPPWPPPPLHRRLRAQEPTALEKHEAARQLSVGLYNEMPPFHVGGRRASTSNSARRWPGAGGEAVSLLPFNADENMNDDLRNMVWRGHYLGFGPADVLLHVPVDRPLMVGNPRSDLRALLARAHRDRARPAAGAGDGIAGQTSPASASRCPGRAWPAGC
jgi:hypothetical protein